jgi:HSP20 family protein
MLQTIRRRHMMNAPRPKPPGRPVPFPEQMERMFDRFARGPRRRFLQRMRGGEWVPDIDVFEEENVTVVRADLPGVKRRDFDIWIEGGTLHIDGQREEEQTEKAEFYSERPLGRFSRTVQLPEGIDPNAIEASYNDGVLELRIPHSPAEPRRTVKVPIH